MSIVLFFWKLPKNFIKKLTKLTANLFEWGLLKKAIFFHHDSKSS